MKGFSILFVGSTIARPPQASDSHSDSRKRKPIPVTCVARAASDLLPAEDRSMRIDRRAFVTGASALIATPELLKAFTQKAPRPAGPTPTPAAAGAATHNLRIEPVTLDIAPGVSIK